MLAPGTVFSSTDRAVDVPEKVGAALVVGAARTGLSEVTLALLLGPLLSVYVAVALQMLRQRRL